VGVPSEVELSLILDTTLVGTGRPEEEKELESDQWEKFISQEGGVDSSDFAASQSKVSFDRTSDIAYS
jgi:hypothetical protein